MSRVVALVCAIVAALAAGVRAQNAPVDAAFDAFWSAASRQEAATRVDAIVRSRPSFDEAYRRVARGPPQPPPPTPILPVGQHAPPGRAPFFLLTPPLTNQPRVRGSVRLSP